MGDDDDDGDGATARRDTTTTTTTAIDEGVARAADLENGDAAFLSGAGR
jgi:hypothetical protein